ncbi:MAG: aminotransferase class III-fold pyridoxal phosphate-dependent enzyme [Candidatus Nanopelagicales bacterium]
MTDLWHGFADMAAVESDGELLVARGEGAYVWDSAGNRYLDATAGLWFANVGHGRTAIAEAVRDQLSTLAAYSTFNDVANPAATALASRVAGLAPVPGSKVFFTSGGSDSVDTAVKLVRRYWQMRGQPQRRVILVRDKAYHGMHLAGTALAGIDDNRAGYGDLDRDVQRVAWDDAEDLARSIDRIGAENVAAFFCEPVIGAGGVYFAGADYLRDARRVCSGRDVLWVSDEVITGFGRLGDWFASSRFELRPDLVLCAKGLTSGYVPMGAVIAAPRVWEPFWHSGAGAWRHGYTYGGHAGAAAAGLANLEIMAAEDLPGRARSLEGALAAALRPLADLPAVHEVRAGTGLMAAVQLADAAAVPTAVARLREEGVLTRGLVGGALQISPPLVVTEDDLALLGDALARALG